MTNEICRMSSMIRAGTSQPACFNWWPIFSPTSSGMNHHSVTEITKAAMNPSGTRKRFMDFRSSDGRPRAASICHWLASGP